MTSVLSMPKSRAKLGKKGFPMSHKFKFTSSTGMLLPVLYDQLNPNEKVSIKFDLFTRTQAVLTPAMIDCDEFIDVFFVPFGRVSLTAEDTIMNVRDIHSSIVDDNVVSYDAVFPLLDDHTDSLEAYFTNPINPIAVYGERFDTLVQGYLRLSEHLGLNPYSQVTSFYSGSTGDPVIKENYTPSFDPVLFYVYQSIYFDYYRLSNWESFISEACNLDVWMQNDGFNTPVQFSQILSYGGGRGLNAFLLRYRPYQRDYFKAIEPSPLIQSLGLMDNNTATMGAVNQWLQTFNNIIPMGDSGANSPDATSTKIVMSSPAQTSAAAIRQLFAVDKMLRAIGQNGKHYDDQVLARFGFEVPHDVRHEIKYLGRHVQQLHIGEVISTADSGGVALGDLAGRGYSKGQSDTIKYTAPCHGFIMAIYSCVPRLTYVPGIDKFNTMHKRWDYYQPELDELGLQPLFGYEMFAGTPDCWSSPASRIGWQPRYMQLKCKYDRATRAFCYEESNTPLIDGMFSDWTIAVHGVNKLFSTSPWTTIFTNLLCSPQDLNSIFVKQYGIYSQSDIDTALKGGTSLPNILYGNDNLIHDLTISYSKTSTMSTFGIEDL